MQSEIETDRISIDSRETRAATPAPTLQGEKHSKAEKDSDGEDVIFVDWDGPDDPTNPQK